MSRRSPRKSSAGDGKPARTGQSAKGRAMGDAVTGTGMPDKRRLLYICTVYIRAEKLSGAGFALLVISPVNAVKSLAVIKSFLGVLSTVGTEVCLFCCCACKPYAVLFEHGQILVSCITLEKNMNGQSIKRNMTDVELCIELAREAGDDYRLALDVMTAYPDYAKTKFRIVVEHLTETLAKKFNIDIEHFDLHGSINELYECQIIDHSLRTELHAIRKLGNEVVHSKQTKNHGATDAEEPSKGRGAGDLQSAVAARKKLVGVFESVFLLINKGEELPDITIVEVGDITSQQTLWKAVSTMDFEAKMAAGLILEAQSLAPITQGRLIIARCEHAHKKTTEKMAAELYWAACVISARVDRFNLMEIEQMGGEEACLFKYANTEALFQYSQLTFDQLEGEENQQRGVKALEVAAKRGYPAACVEYGNFLRQKGRFDEAFDFLSHGLAKGEISGHTGLGLLYLEKSYSNYSQKLAEECFIAGINSGSNHCKYILGRFLYVGDELELDKERGKALLKEAADAGYETAAHYYALAVDDKLAKRLQEFAFHMMLTLPKVPVGQKQGRNELCDCGSGKKYKKCCGA